MNFFIITISIIIIFLLFLIYGFFIASQRPLATNIYLPKGVSDIQLTNIKIRDYSSYNIEFWIYVNKLPELAPCNNAECKNWFPNDSKHWPAYSASDCNSWNNSRGLDGNSTGLIFNTNNDQFSLDLYKNGTLTFYNGRVKRYPDGGYLSYPSVMTTNFPVQKWTYVIISVTNNSLVELYINGKLVQSSNYNGTEINSIQKPSATSVLQFGKKLDATITKMHINSNSMNTTTAWNNYLKGNGINSKMNVSLHLTQNNKISNSLQVL